MELYALGVQAPLPSSLDVKLSRHIVAELRSGTTEEGAIALFEQSGRPVRIGRDLASVKQLYYFFRGTWRFLFLIADGPSLLTRDI